jgi:hypothetical protein
MPNKLSEAWKSTKEYVRETDMFGHTIALNFERSGDTYNTYTGGFFSIFVKLFLMFYVGTCFKRMLWKERDSVLTFVGAQDLVDLGVVDYSKLQATFLHSIRKTDGTDIS